MRLSPIALAITCSSTIVAFQPSLLNQWSQSSSCTYNKLSTFSWQTRPRTISPLCSSVPKLGNTSRFHPNKNDNESNAQLPLPRSPKGVIFDMDGTLIQHSIDFAYTRKSIYEIADQDPIGQTLERTCVLALANQLSPKGQLKAAEVFAEIEQKAIDEMKLMEGAVELVQFLEENGLHHAVLRRNLEKNVHYMRGLYLDEFENKMDNGESIFYPIVTRDTKAHPHHDEPLRAKPNPDGILHICSVWECHPSEIIMVGDLSNDDMTAANRPGCRGAVLLMQWGGKRLDTDSGYAVGDSEEEILEQTPSLVVESLLDLKDCLEAVLRERKTNGNTYEVLANGKKDEVMHKFPNSDYLVVLPGITVKKCVTYYTMRKLYMNN